MSAEADLIAADVLVLGGGPAGAWAAISAAESGARVVLADKGHCGTSGAAAAGGNNLWYVPPGEARERAVLDREAAAGGLTDSGWMDTVLDLTWQRIADLDAWGYPFPVDDQGEVRRSSLQGPEYMRRLRRKVHRSGVRILDHHPATELLVNPDRAVAGAAGLARQDGLRPWQVLAGATVLATGGCAFLSGSFGTNVDTGDGYLMAAETGAELSGMEFSTAYALSAAWGVHTKGLMMKFANYYHPDGHPLEIPEGRDARSVAVDLLARGFQVHARLDRAPIHLRAAMREAQPNYFLPLERAGIDPFTDPYPLRMVYEGTVRGTGGLRILDDGCATSVPGLFAAGDAATRELVTGAISGGGSHNGAWAISSGTLAGRAAARYGKVQGELPANLARRVARVGLTPTPAASGQPTAQEVIAHAREQVIPPAITHRRTASGLLQARSELEQLWQDAVGQLTGDGRDLLRNRQAAALVATGRWITAAALERTESRGMHRRADFADLDPRWGRRLLVGGLDRVWTRPDPIAPRLAAARAAVA